MLSLVALSASGFALWQTPPTGAAAEPPVQLIPQRLSRLTLPVYGTEHLLLFQRTEAGDDDDRVLPVLLRFREGEQLEQLDALLGRGERPQEASAAVGVECAARGRLFEAAAGRTLAPWDLLKLGSGCSSFWEALLAFLEKTGWTPERLELGAEAGGGKARYREEAKGLQTRDMGMFTEPSPSTVRVGELRTALVCTRAGGEEELLLELEGPGEAVLLACYGGPQLEAAASEWERRATTEAKLPELVAGSTREGVFAALASGAVVR